MATIEEASKCPICHQAGDLSSSSTGSKGSKLYNYMCRNRNCRWFDTGWLVQVDRNGDVYERPKGEKEFAEFSPYQAARIEAELEALKNTRNA